MTDAMTLNLALSELKRVAKAAGVWYPYKSETILALIARVERAEEAFNNLAKAANVETLEEALRQGKETEG